MQDLPDDSQDQSQAKKGRFYQLQGAFGFGEMPKDFKPFDRAKSMLAYMMSWPLFIPFFTVNLLILASAVIAFILELVTLFSNWSISSVSYNDAMSYSLFVLAVPLMMLAIGCMLGAFGGRLFFIDFYGQLLFFIAVTLATILGWFGGIVAEIVSWGRYSTCIKGGTKGHSAFCADEKASLLWVAIIVLFLLLLSLIDWGIAFLMLFVRSFQYAAIGMDTTTIRDLHKLSNKPQEQRRKFNFWLTNKQRGDAHLPLLKDDATAGGEETAAVFGVPMGAYGMPVANVYKNAPGASVVQERVGAAHRAVAAQAYKQLAAGGI